MQTNVDDTADPEAPEFWSQRLDKIMKRKWKQAIDDYLIAYDKEPEQVEFNIGLVKECLRFLKKHDSRWKGFNKDDFNTYAYPGHMQFYQQIRNRLDSLIAEKKKETQALEKKLKEIQQQKTMTVPELVEETQQVENITIVPRKSLRKSNEADNRSTGSKKTKTPVKEEPKLFEGP